MEYPVVPVPLTSCPCCGGKYNTHYKGCNKKIKDDITAVLDALREKNRPLLNFRDSEPNDRVNDLLDEIRQLYQDLTLTYNDAITRLNAELDAAVKGTARRLTKTGPKVKRPPADYILH